MTEKQPATNSEECRRCPERGRLSGFMARIAGKNETTPDCGGSAELQRVDIGGELTQLTPDEGLAIAIGNPLTGDELYSQVSTTTKTICGREIPVPGPGEELLQFESAESDRTHVRLVTGAPLSVRGYLKKIGFTAPDAPDAEVSELESERAAHDDKPSS